MTWIREEERLKKAAERKHQRRLEMRRGYYRAARAREGAIASDGIQDLPIEVAVRVEEALKTPALMPELVKPPDATVEELTVRLAAIKERVFRLHAVFAVSLSHDAAMEANRYIILFQDLAQRLEEKDADALRKIVEGHEAILMSPTVPLTKAIPIEVQRDAELRWEVNQAPARREPTPPTVTDGLDWLVR